MPDEVKNRIAELEKELYSKEFKPRPTEDVLTRKVVPEAPSWDTAKDAATLLREQAALDARHQKMKKFVKLSIGFFVFAALVAGFIWWRGTNVISGENIGIDISAPTNVAGGEPFETTFLVTNKNQVSIEAATLLTEYPAGFYSVSDKAALPRISKDLGPISPGQSVSEKINTLLYGEQNSVKDINVTLEYRIAGSNATLRKTATYSIKILSSPVNLQLGMLKEASSGQVIDFSIDVTSNSKDPLKQLLVNATYPWGFKFSSANPAPTYGTNTWVIPGLEPQEKRTILIHGTLEGIENEEKITKVAIGTQSPTDDRAIGTIYNATTESLTITKPFIGLDLALDGEHTAEHVVTLGRDVKADIYWQSNNPTKINDVVIEATLKGNALNRYQIYASSGGFYRSIDDTIVWDKTGAPELGMIEPGAKGGVSFGFSPVALGIDAGRIIRNPQISLEVRVRGKRVSDSNVSGDVTTFASRIVKFETDLRLTAKGLYYSGPFTNSGPMPPKVEKETTYTVALSARNSSNDVSSVVAKTTLPIYVKWLGKISPTGEDLTYDEATNEVIWNVGRIPAGGGRDVAFQISLLPSLSQARQVPALTGPISLTGTDDFTKTSVHDNKPGITTALPSDPSFVQRQATVVN